MRNLLITGGTRGIGRAISLRESAPGTQLFVNFLRDDAAAAALQSEAEKKGARVVLIQANVAEPEEITRLFAEVSKHTSVLDAMIHSAALGVFKPVHQLRVKDWDISLDVNAKAFLLLAQGALPMMKSKGGKMLTISSLGAGRYTPNYGAIGISKAALENLVRYLAAELAVHKIQVNAVSGGLIETDSLKMFPEFEKMKTDYQLRTRGARLGRPEDIAKVAAFLLSADSDWVTGQTLVADGGYSLS